MKKDIIIIKPQRKNIPTYTAEWDGQLYDAPFYWWSSLTDTTVACMCARRKAMAIGRRDYTIRQILGMDDINYSPADNLPSIDETKSLFDIHKEKKKTDPVALFLSRKLVPLSGCTTE